MNSLFCGQCGAPIPPDSIFCPMCGFKAVLPGAVTMFQMPRAMTPPLAAPAVPAASAPAAIAPPPASRPAIPPRYEPAGHRAPPPASRPILPPPASRSAIPPPAAIPPPPGSPPSVPFVVPPPPAMRSPGRPGPTGLDRSRTADPSAGRPRTAELSVPPPIEPAPAQAPRRHAEQRAWSTPPSQAAIPVTPRPLRIVLGGLFFLLAIWLAVFFLPGHRPLDEAEEAALSAKAGQGEVLRQREFRFTEQTHIGGNVGAAALALAGIGLALSGAFHRSQVHVRCRRCQRAVIAWKGAFGLHCPHGEHYARVQWLLVGLTAMFWASLLVLALVIAIWLG